MDVCRPLPIKSLGYSCYFILFMDDYSRFSWIYFISTKHQALEIFNFFCIMAEKQIGYQILYLRSNRGGEYLSINFTSYLENNRIMWQLSVAWTPQQNGIAKKKKYTILNKIRTMLLKENISMYLWIKVAYSNIHLVNSSPIMANKGRTPCKIFMKTKPDLNQIYIFECLYFVGKDITQYHKLEVQSKRRLYLGIDIISMAYRIVLLSHKKILITKDVHFNKNKFFTSSNNNSNFDTSDLMSAHFNK